MNLVYVQLTLFYLWCVKKGVWYGKRRDHGRCYSGADRLALQEHRETADEAEQKMIKQDADPVQVILVQVRTEWLCGEARILVEDSTPGKPLWEMKRIGIGKSLKVSLHGVSERNAKSVLRWYVPAFSVVNFKTWKIWLLEENVKAFISNDFYVDCDYYETEDETNTERGF